MENFTIHIFGYGETQINSSEFSVKVKTDSLKKVTAVVDSIWAKKPTENESVKDYHAINILGFNDIRWMSKPKGFTLKNELDLKPLIEDLISELKTAFDALPVKA